MPNKIQQATGVVNNITELIAALSPVVAAGRLGVLSLIAMIKAAHPTLTNEELNAAMLPVMQQKLAEEQELLRERADVLAEIASAHAQIDKK